MEFRQVARATLAPSRCFFCQANDGPMIDTGIQRPAPTGHVYLCVNRCLRDFIRAGGGLSGEEAAFLRTSRHQAQERADALDSEVKRLERFERAIRDAQPA